MCPSVAESTAQRSREYNLSWKQQLKWKMTSRLLFQQNAIGETTTTHQFNDFKGGYYPKLVGYKFSRMILSLIIYQRIKFMIIVRDKIDVAQFPMQTNKCVRLTYPREFHGNSRVNGKPILPFVVYNA